MRLTFKFHFDLNLDYWGIKEEDVLEITFKEGCLYIETKTGSKILDISDELIIQDLELEE